MLEIGWANKFDPFQCLQDQTAEFRASAAVNCQALAACSSSDEVLCVNRSFKVLKRRFWRSHIVLSLFIEFSLIYCNKLLDCS